jgi:lambda family phage minor tail protein L
MGMGIPTLAASDASTYFLQALEAQRSINSHIHEIEPTTPIFLYEIDLNEIRPASISYPNKNGPVKDGVIRIHNDFNLFQINKGVIKWRGNLYFPFPIYGEQFDITSNGTIPTPKVKFSSQFLDDEFNSFYKYIRMQIQELKDIVGSKVTRRKTFVRYLSPDNFQEQVNPFNTFLDTPWASRDGEVLTVRSRERVGSMDYGSFSKWLIYTLKSNRTTNKIFTCLRTDDRLKTLGIDLQSQNYFLNSLDFFNLYVDQKVQSTADIVDSFSSDVFIVPGSTTYTNIINDPDKEFKKKGTNNTIKILSYGTPVSFNGSTSATASYPTSFSESGSELVTFLSFKRNDESVGENFNYSIASQSSSSFTTYFSKPLYGNFEMNYLTIPTGCYTGINKYSNEDATLISLKLTPNFGSSTSGQYNIIFPKSFSNVPKILFNSWGNAGFLYNQYLDNISTTGCTFYATHTGNNAQLQTQNINLIATDYITDSLTLTGEAQIYTAYQNLARSHMDEIENKRIDTYEVELTPDIYYIDRKVQEDSQNVVYELASLLDIEGIKLPGRLLLSKNCPFTYRGEGCLYERKDRLNKVHSGVYADVDHIVQAMGGPGNERVVTFNISDSQKALGLKSAPPVATQEDASFFQYTGTTWIDRGHWSQNVSSYITGNYIHIEKNYIKYYFVCKQNHEPNLLNAPPNTKYWGSDSCSKTLHGCRLRWKENFNFSKYQLSALNVTGTALLGSTVTDNLLTIEVQAPIDGNGQQLMGVLPFGGFPSVEGKFQSQQSPGS